MFGTAWLLALYRCVAVESVPENSNGKGVGMERMLILHAPKCTESVLEIDRLCKYYARNIACAPCLVPGAAQDGGKLNLDRTQIMRQGEVTERHVDFVSRRVEESGLEVPPRNFLGI
ncbi:hypothetical protein E2C01_009213 [Portunus trituberculatus]|uniref:Uncharacterized protein n=1 Tax=Portunus trituberculatus TaxID=210409 RepID=A0A5B7D410_PORTR|nr:hypothetical protein [Portunus trituberculatus]